MQINKIMLIEFGLNALIAKSDMAIGILKNQRTLFINPDIERISALVLLLFL